MVPFSSSTTTKSSQQKVPNVAKQAKLPICIGVDHLGLQLDICHKFFPYRLTLTLQIDGSLTSGLSSSGGVIFVAANPCSSSSSPSMEMAASENGAASGAETSPAAAADDAEAVDVDVVDAKGDVTADDRVAARVAELEAEVGEVRAKNEALQRNLDDALSEICVAGCVKEPHLRRLRREVGR